MTTTGSVGSGTTVSGRGGTSGSGSALDGDAFMRLMIAQLKNQDPSEPMDTGQFMSQLASFTQVEQAVAANAKLDALLSASALAQADGLIGRTVTSADGSVSGTIAALRVTSADPVAMLADGRELTLGAGVTVA
jgi:flagellar basal-body rod modification protein FlgD